MVANACLKGNQINYKNIIQAVRSGRDFEIPPAWSKGEMHAWNKLGWLNKVQYTKWGKNSKFLDFCFRLCTGVLHTRKQLHRYGFVASPEMPSMQ
jgi:hypothetical protein